MQSEQAMAKINDPRRGENIVITMIVLAGATMAAGYFITELYRDTHPSFIDPLVQSPRSSPPLALEPRAPGSPS
jgi:hypothetical protein